MPAAVIYGKINAKGREKMKNLKITALLLCVFLLFTACGQKIPVYDKDTELGSGAKTLTVKVIDDEASEIVFTIHTDAKTVGDALLEHKLISGEDSEYGMYIKIVNGLSADYNTDKAYWSFSKNGEYMMTGVDGTEFADGDVFELTYTKA